MKFTNEQKVLSLYLEGELNSSNAEKVEKEIDQVLEAQKFEKLVLDFANVKYISSAGLRIILKLKKLYKDISINEVSLEVYDIFQMTGFTNMMEIKKALREVDVSNAEVIGQGFFSTVYRINKDTIIKVFKRTSDTGQIERELKLAKQAFILGIPTAISFDIVKVGQYLGVCFEMLDCKSLQKCIIDYPDKREEYLAKYADLLKRITTTECFDPNIPHMRDTYLDKIAYIEKDLDKKHFEKAKKLIESLEDRQTLVHGDCHFKNIMVQNEDLLLIDMDTLSIGHPIFEFAQIYAPYVAFNEDDHGNSEKFFGISEEESNYIYNTLVNIYFGKDDEIIKDKIKLVSYIHMVWWNRVNEKENDKRFNGCRNRLYELLDRYDDLDLGI